MVKSGTQYKVAVLGLIYVYILFWGFIHTILYNFQVKKSANPC